MSSFILHNYIYKKKVYILRSVDTGGNNSTSVVWSLLVNFQPTNSNPNSCSITQIPIDIPHILWDLADARSPKWWSDIVSTKFRDTDTKGSTVKTASLHCRYRACSLNAAESCPDWMAGVWLVVESLHRFMLVVMATASSRALKMQACVFIPCVYYPAVRRGKYPHEIPWLGRVVCRVLLSWSLAACMACSMAYFNIKMSSVIIHWWFLGGGHRPA